MRPRACSPGLVARTRHRGHPPSAPRGCGCRVRARLAWARLARSRGAARARVGGRPRRGGRGLPRYLRPRPPPRGEDALFRQLPGSSQAGERGSALPRQWGPSYSSSSLLLSCQPGGARVGRGGGRRQLAGEEGWLQGGERCTPAPHHDSRAAPWGHGGAGTRGADGEGESRGVKARAGRMRPYSPVVLSSART